MHLLRREYTQRDGPPTFAGRSIQVSRSMLVIMPMDVVAWPLGIPYDLKYKQLPGGLFWFMVCFKMPSFMITKHPIRKIKDRLVVSPANRNAANRTKNMPYGTKDQKIMKPARTSVGADTPLGSAAPDTERSIPIASL